MKPFNSRTAFGKPDISSSDNRQSGGPRSRNTNGSYMQSKFRTDQVQHLNVISEQDAQTREQYPSELQHHAPLLESNVFRYSAPSY